MTLSFTKVSRISNSKIFLIDWKEIFRFKVQNKKYSTENILCAKMSYDKKTQCTSLFAWDTLFLDKMLILQLKISLSFFFLVKPCLRKIIHSNWIS